MVPGKMRRVLKKMHKMSRAQNLKNNPDYVKTSRMVSELNAKVHYLYSTNDYDTIKQLFELLNMDLELYKDEKSKYAVISEISARRDDDFENTVWLKCRKKGIISKELRYFEK